MDWTIVAGVRFGTCQHSRGRVDVEVSPDEPRIIRFNLTTFAEIEEARRRLAMSSGPCTQATEQPRPKRRRKPAAEPKQRKQA